ncbi:serine/threonine-protein kinase [Kineococcus arenarius]|uniref:serine/threonine-protein kinase n=1 Tax=Kineococcus sp. SYSU DK007 TaxID=3383128 RepID=UPI003D7D52A8
MPLDDVPPGDLPGDLPGHPLLTPSGEPVGGVRTVRRGRHAAPAGEVAGGAGAGVAGAVREARRAALAALGQDPRRVPPRVDGYDVRHLLGAGGSAVVWAGAGPDGVLRALKVLQPADEGVDPDGTGPDGADPAQGLLHELSLLRRVRHPRVVAVHDISRDDAGRPVLVLDLAPGGSLAQVLHQRRRLGAAEVVGLLNVLGPALEELHSAGVVHGDLAPGNVLVDARGEPLLADLGLARVLGRRHGSVLGTPGFADPAVLGGGDVDAAADVYGLAAVAWWALTGQAPAAGGAGASRRAARRAGSQLPAGTSAELLGVLRTGLQRKPSRRPTPGELAQAAAGCAQPRPVRAAVRTWGDGDPLRRPVEAAGEPAPGAATTGPAAASAPVTRPVRGAAPGVPATTGARKTGARETGARERGTRAVRPARRPHRRLLLGAGAALCTAAALGAVLVLRPGTPAAGAAGAAAPAAPAAPAVPAAEVVVPGAPGPAQTLAGPVVAAAPAGEEGAEEVGARVLRGGDPGAVVRELAARRADALRELDTAALEAVDAPGSAALRSDTALLQQARDGGTRWSGLGFDVVGVVVEEAAPGRMVVVADVVTQAHEVLGAGAEVTSVPASAPRTSRLTLVRVEGQWRVQEVG